MEKVENTSVHLVVTSPPYWNIKDYGRDTQIGFGQSYEDYLADLTVVWKECHRILFDGCKLCINVGDIFARIDGQFKVIPLHQNIIQSCIGIGLDYMGTIIWQKIPNVHPNGGAVFMGSYPFPRNGIVKLDYEYILIFKKPGIAPRPEHEQKEESRMTKEEWKQYFTGIWNVPGVRQNKHIAMFPEELPKRLIKMFSFAGEMVLDPFVGSGTTLCAAQALGRNSTGYELNPAYIPMIKEKLSIEKTNNSKHGFIGNRHLP